MTLPLRRVVFWMHVTAGLVAGVVILVMSVTGVLLTYEKQMIRWADGHRVSAPRSASVWMPIDALVAAAEAARPGAQPAAVVIRRDGTAPVELSFGRDGSIFVDPYTGAVLGAGSTRARAFFRGVTEWHRYLGRRDDARAIGKAVTGACNLAFFFLVLSGFYLWWPRTWTWTQFRHVLWFRRGVSGKARDFNWHHVIGYWSLVPLAVIVWSGVVISYPWATDLTYRLAGETPPPRATPASVPSGSVPATAGPLGERSLSTRDSSQSLDRLVARAAEHTGDWTIISAKLPLPSQGPVSVTVDAGTGAQPHKRGTLQLERATGAEVAWEPFAASSRGRQWRTWLRFTHTGEWYGIAGQTIAGIVTTGVVVLVWTGMALSWRRFRAWVLRRRGTASERQSRRIAA